MDKITSAADLGIYKDEANFRVLAGPGAGKTHLLIENIKNIVKNSKRIKTNNHRKILCITYTNAAVEEITERLGSFSKYVVVSTIHSFINQHIISPFQKQLRLFIKEKFEIDVPDDVKISSVQEGFTVLSGHTKEDICGWIKENYPVLPEAFYNEISRSKMTSVEVDISAKNVYPYNEYSDVQIKEVLNKDLTMIIKKYIWAVAGRLSFDEILYFGLSLIEKYPIILYMLRAEFPYILMDEYQDTNPIQNKILNLISEKECSVVVVGDVAQSIFAFQGATYQEFLDFSLKSPLPIEHKAIEGNRRSTQNIINLINFIRKSDKDFKQECIKNRENNEKITFLIQMNNERLATSIKELVSDDTKILCRRWTDAFSYIDDVDEPQKKLISSIYNTYAFQVHRDIWQAIDSKREDWIRSTLDIAELERCCKNKNMPGALKILENYLNIRDLFKEVDKEKLEKLQNLFGCWKGLFSNNLDDCLLKDLIERVNAVFCDIEGIDVLEPFKYPNPDNEEEYFEPVYKHVDNLTYAAAKKIVLELFSDNARYMTIHKSKGKEFNSVLVNLTPFARGIEKDFDPVEIFSNPVILNSANKGKEEYMRIAYVGCSRAINKLYVHLKGNEETAEIIKNAINDYYRDYPNKQDFFDFVFC